MALLPIAQVARGDYVGNPPLIRPSALTRVSAGGVGKDLSDGYSLNFATGCTHACPFCVVPETPVLMADFSWRPAEHVKVGDRLVGFESGTGKFRRLREAVVEAVAERIAETIELGTAHGSVICTPDHRWLSRTRFRRARTIDALRFVSAPVQPPNIDFTYRWGYLHGAMAGDGTVSSRPTQRRALLRVADRLFADRFYECGVHEGLEGLRRFEYNSPNGTRMYGVRTSRVREVESLDPFGQGPFAALWKYQDYKRGWLAGAYDAEGGQHDARIYQRADSTSFIDRCTFFLHHLQIPYTIEDRGRSMIAIRIHPFREQLRFFSMVRPALSRKYSRLLSTALKFEGSASEVVSRRPAGLRRVVSIQTSTGTLVEGGFASHNCYVAAINLRGPRASRPEVKENRWGDYMLVPENMDELIRDTVWSKWNGKEVMMSSTHDPYLPELAAWARRILEAALPAGVRVDIHTRSVLVLKDLPLLQEYRDQVRIQVSLATMDPAFARLIEPRVPGPKARLKILEKATAAGVPVGVTLAPIFPQIPHRGAAHQDIKDLVAAVAPFKPTHIYGESLHVRGVNMKYLEEDLGYKLVDLGRWDEHAETTFNIALREHKLEGTWWPER